MKHKNKQYNREKDCIKNGDTSIKQYKIILTSTKKITNII